MQEALRYRSDIRPMAGVDTLTQALASSESDQPEVSSDWDTSKMTTAIATATKGGRRRVVQR